MSKVTVQNVVVTDEGGNDLYATFEPLTLTDREVRGVIVYKTVTPTPAWRRYIPGLDDLDETFLAEEPQESLIFDLDPVLVG